MPKVLQVILATISSFVILFVLAKMLGKKQIAELDFTDYVVGITIGSIAAEWATDTQTPWYHYVIAIALFAFLSLIVDFIERKSLFLKRVLKGKPLIIVEAGKINYKNLKKSKLTINDVIGMCRVKNYFDLNDIAFAIFENSGDLSILPKSNLKPIVAEDMNIKNKPASLTKYLITDGKINKNYLKSIGKDENWLLKILGLHNIKECKNIVLAGYDFETKQKFIHYKNEK